MSHPVGLYALLAFAIMVGVGTYLFNQPKTDSNVLGTTVVGSESKEVCWHGVGTAEKYQLYYGQMSTGNKDSAIYAGLTNSSRCVKVNYLKPCTTYIWNLQRLDGGKWSWQWGSDQQFTTGGVCEKAPGTPTTPIVGNGKATVTWNVADGATKYYIFYRSTSEANWSNGVEVPPNASNYTINYLGTNQGYMYRVAALVNGKLIWQSEKNLVVN